MATLLNLSTWGWKQKTTGNAYGYMRLKIEDSCIETLATGNAYEESKNNMNHVEWK